MLKSEIPKEHFQNIPGKGEVITYKGLLDMAHKRGLRGIDTELLQAPTPENGNTAICSARVAMMVDGEVMTFTGIGDANPGNVNRNIAPHAIRMAETRAKGRALRDALNIGEAAAEEFGGYEEEAPAPKAKAPATDTGKVTPIKGKGTLASQAQVQLIAIEMKRVGWTQEDGIEYLEMTFGKQSRKELTGDEASSMIEYLRSLEPKAGAQ